MTKDKRVAAELKRLEDIFQGVDENKLDFVSRHIAQLAWLNISVLDLQKEIDEEGTMLEYHNGGGQDGVRQNPNCKLLLDYQKVCNTIIRTLLPLVPDVLKTSKLSAFFNCDDLRDD